MQTIEEYLESFLLKDIIIKTDEKILKKGKLILYNTKQFYIRLTIQPLNSEAYRLYEIPYPFQIHKNDQNNILSFNYKLSNLCDKDCESMEIIQSARNSINNTSRMYDKFVHILPLA